MPTPYQMFVAQLQDFLQQYGGHWLAGTVVASVAIGLFVHYWLNIRPFKKVRERDLLDTQDAKLDEQIREQQKSDGGNVKLVGKMMNTSDFAKRQTVHFNDTPKTDSIKSTTKGAGNEKNGEGAGSDESDGSEKESEEETLMQRDKDSDSDEYEMPPMNNRYVKKKTMKVPAPSMDCPEDNLKANEEHERDIVAKIGELHGKLATARLRSQARKLEQSMTQEEREEEAAVRQRQLEQIMQVMMENKDKFGMPSEDDVKDQLRMYNF
ncbi:hypothetical protein WR25_04392 isoform A [Diploscapter pachys]|uniref:Matrix-remodeling-associated protein 7 helical domain-containing protein n=1 Tax=Diploscapter pachys TaxID=2018661 RepID=A0A2A2JWH7_9BILA|nr:hypothetical protein WR25_04392 isoform A [Diploscapter pachys]